MGRSNSISKLLFMIPWTSSRIPCIPCTSRFRQPTYIGDGDPAYPGYPAPEPGPSGKWHSVQVGVSCSENLGFAYLLYYSYILELVSLC